MGHLIGAPARLTWEVRGSCLGATPAPGKEKAHAAMHLPSQNVARPSDSPSWCSCARDRVACRLLIRHPAFGNTRLWPTVFTVLQQSGQADFHALVLLLKKWLLSPWEKEKNFKDNF